MNSYYVIKTSGLTKRFGRILAVDNLSLQVPRGQVFGLLGPNGSGKTTTMNMLLGLIRPTAGQFSLLGSSERSDKTLRRVGAIIESPTFYPYLTGRQNLAYFQGVLGRGSPEELDSLLEQVRLGGRGDHRYQTYSLGMKQRLGLAYTLLGDPELLFLDEPTNGMDPAGVAEIRGMIRDLATGGRTVLLSSHLLNEVEQVCDSVAILSKGRLIAQGNIKDLLHTQDQIRLRTTDNDEAFQILSDLDWVQGVKTRDGSLVVTAPVNRSWELTAVLSQSRVYVTEMRPITLSLEDYFMEVTGEEGFA